MMAITIPTYIRFSKDEVRRVSELFKANLPASSTDNDHVHSLLHFVHNNDNDLMRYWLLGDHYISDKWIHYFSIYDEWLSRYRYTDITFAEVGVQRGGSLQMWKSYFGKKARIIGIDINPSCKRVEEDQIIVETGDQSSISFWNHFKVKYPKVDVLLDDGGHTMVQQKVTFNQMFPHISDRGLYICEDCHTSYFEGAYGGGYKKSSTFIELMKSVVDELTAYFIKNHKPTYNTDNIRGMHFYDSIVVIEKYKRLLPPVALQLGSSQ